MENTKEAAMSDSQKNLAFEKRMEILNELNSMIKCRLLLTILSALSSTLAFFSKLGTLTLFTTDQANILQYTGAVSLLAVGISFLFTKKLIKEYTK